ncbi:MAG: NYN domain-containing protein, partial [Chloroflexi bacterium]|nr:NYN domain-containing protein [Chloroflexota bacterium]
FRTYYYNVWRDAKCIPQAYQDQQKFLSALYNASFLEVRLGGSKVRGDTAVEKGVDIMLATDLLRFGWDDLYDVAIVVSGDGDFAYALQAVKDMGKHVEVAAFTANLAWELAQVADEREFFTPEYFADLWSRGRSRTARSAPAEKPVAEKPAETATPKPAARRGWRRGRSRSSDDEKKAVKSDEG